MEACRAELTITAAMLAEHPAFVAEGLAGIVNGFSLLVQGVPGSVLDYLYIRPEAMGAGLGRALFERAAAHAVSLGSARMIWDADPHAVPFYQRMGAYSAGESPSGSIPGRMLPRMRIDWA